MRVMNEELSEFSVTTPRPHKRHGRYKILKMCITWIISWRETAIAVAVYGRYCVFKKPTVKNGTVTFKWQDYRDNSRWKVITLSADEFIQCFLMHVLPS